MQNTPRHKAEGVVKFPWNPRLVDGGAFDLGRFGCRAEEISIRRGFRRFGHFASEIDVQHAVFMAGANDSHVIGQA